MFDAPARVQTYDWSNVAGPVALAYEMNEAPISVIVGPTGGGKTTGSVRRNLRVTLMQHVSPRDGMRKAKICCLASSYRVLWDTAIASYRDVFPTEGPQKWGHWTGSYGQPADHVFDFVGPDGAPCRLIMEFRSPGDHELEDFMRGRQVTGWWLPEMDTLDRPGILSLAHNRSGRYPPPDDRNPNLPKAWSGVFGDANAPRLGGWFHDRFYLNSAKHSATDKLFLQPAFDQPGAENLHNLNKLNPNYYRDLAAGMDEYDVNRLLRCKPGWSRSGKPVHEDFDVRDHVAPGEIDPVEGVLLEIGVDAGNTLKPAATFGQRVMGQRRVMAEISPKGRQLDLIEFGREIRRIKDTRFPHVKNAVIWVDPSARAASPMNRALSWAQVLQAESGIVVKLAPSNAPPARRTALRTKLKARHGWIADPVHCPDLIAALAGGFCFATIKRATGGESQAESPVKNDHSHVAEAEEYGCLGSEGLGVEGGGFISPRAGPVHSNPAPILPGGVSR